MKTLCVGCIALLISISRFSAGAFPLLSAETRLAASGLVALSGNGNFAVIGGQVFARGPNGWALQQTFQADGPAALSGNTLLLGLTIFIRTNDNWALQATLPISVPPWAMVVALDGDTAVEALPFGSYDSWFNPRVDIFTRTNGLWSQAARLAGTNYVGVFGASAALQANRLVVGAPSSFYFPTETSAVYVFRRDGTNWAQEAKLTAPSVSSNLFGRWVAFSGSTIAVANPTGPEHVVLFRRTNNAWTVSQKLSLPAGIPGGQYDPSPIALNGNTLAVLDMAGVVHIFALSGTTWKQQQRLDSGGGYGLGPGLALSTNALLVNVVAFGGSYLYEPRLWTWRSEDIGPVGASGAFNASLTNNFLTVSGAGADIAGTNDAFRFVYRAWTGDVEVVVKVAQINASDPWARGGVMFRGALSSDAPHGFVMLRQGGRTGFQARSEAGDDTSYFSGVWADAPYWLKLSKIGDTITGYTSVNGTSWVAIASAQVRLPQSFYAGVAVTSHQPGTLASANFEHVDFTTSTFPAAPTGLTAVATGTDQITLTWQDNSLSEAGFRVRRFGTSSDWWTVPPNTTTFTDTNYLYPASFYQYTVQAFAPGGWGGESDSVYAYTWSLPAEWLSRDIGPVQYPGSGTLLPPYSPGYSVTGSGSLSGPSPAFQYVFRSWTNDFDFRAYAGFSLSYGAPLGARAGLMIRPSLDPLGPFVMLSTTVGEGDKFILRGTNGTTTLTAPTTWNSKLRFVRRGNTFSAFHEENGGLVLMAETNLDYPDTVFLGFAVAAGTHGPDPATATFWDVYLAGGTNVHAIAAPTLTAHAESPSQIDLSWSDPNFDPQGYVVEEWPYWYNITWLPVTNFYSATRLPPGTSITYRLRSLLPDGDAVWSDLASATTFPAPESNLPPSSWQTAAVGNVATVGSAIIDETNRTFTVWGSGGYIYPGNADAFQYAFRSWNGDGFITAHVWETGGSTGWYGPQCGIMFRQSLAPGAKFASLFVEPRQDATFLARTNANSAPIYAATSFGWGDYLLLTRTGNVFTASASADGVSWTVLGSAVVNFADPVLVGLTVAANNPDYTNRLGYAIFDHVQLGPARPASLAISSTGTAEVRLMIQGLPGWTQPVETSPDLLHWTPWTNPFTASGTLILPDPVWPADQQRFYRALTPN